MLCEIRRCGLFGYTKCQSYFQKTEEKLQNEKFWRKVQMKSSIENHIQHNNQPFAFAWYISIEFQLKKVFLHSIFPVSMKTSDIIIINTSYEPKIRAKKSVWKPMFDLLFYVFFCISIIMQQLATWNTKKKMWKCWPFYWMLRSAMFREIHTKQSLHFKSLLQANKLLRSKSFKYNTFSNV